MGCCAPCEQKLAQRCRPPLAQWPKTQGTEQRFVVLTDPADGCEGIRYLRSHLPSPGGPHYTSILPLSLLTWTQKIILVPDPLWPSRSMKHRSHTQTHLFNLHRHSRNLLGWAEPDLPSPFSHFSDFTPLSAPVAAAGTLRAERCDPCSGQHHRAGAHLMQLHHTRTSPAACGVQGKQLS